MKKIHDYLKNMGVSGLEEFIPASALKLIADVSTNPTTERLTQTVIDVVGLSNLISNKNYLRKIFQYLSEEEAHTFLKILGKNDFGNPWEELKRVSINREKIGRIAEYLHVELIEEEGLEDRREENIKINASYPLRLYQRNVIDNVKSTLLEKSRCLMHMPTGAGKTRTTISLICDFIRNYVLEDESVIWLAYTEELCDQAVEEFQTAWKWLGNREIVVSRKYGSFKENLENVEKGSFVVMGLKFADSRLIHEQSAFLELAKKTKLVIFDEAHLALAPTYKHTIEVLFTTSPETRILGLTATPGRSIKDFEQNDKLSELFYNNKHSINMEGYKNPLDYLQEQGFLAEPTFKLINYSPEDTEFYKRNLQELENSPDIPQSILDQLGEESKRNLLIYNAVKQEIEKGSYIILFACSVEHAKALNAFFTYLGIKSGVVVSGMRKDERNRIIQLYQKKEISVITNFGVLTTGFDAPHTNTAFITRPTRSLVLYSQMIGRAMRGVKSGGNKYCTIYTVNDDLPIFKNTKQAFSYWNDYWRN